MPSFVRLGRALTIIVFAAISSTVSQLNLSPVFGALVASQYHLTLVTSTFVAYFTWHLSPWKQSSDEVPRFLPIHAFNIPALLHWPLFQLGSKLGPIYGPIFVELLTYVPLLFLSCCAFYDCFVREPAWLQYGGVAFAALIFYTIQSWSHQLLSQFIGMNILITRWALQLILATFYAITFPSKLLVGITPALLFSLYNNVHAPLPRSTMKLNRNLHPYGYTLLERRESVTGYISVLEENKKNHFRMLRCDHSLLGGEWLVTSQSRKHGITVPEPIYSVFTMLEAVRLMVDDGEYRLENEAHPKSALVIGLGIGTGPKALAAHGIATTAIEVDPVVTEFATKYFGLPANVTTINKDVIEYLRNEPSDSKYDYIVHDVFTGGAEPVDLFTFEFLSSLRNRLTPLGSIAINYAGDLDLPSTALVLSTINAVFNNCKAYRDAPPNKESAALDFINIVVFCTNSGGPWHFRDAVEVDFLQSQSRRQYLVPKYELNYSALVTLDSMKGEVLNASNKHVLAKYQQRSAVQHWRIMRQVLPGAVWENW